MAVPTTGQSEPAAPVDPRRLAADLVQHASDAIMVVDPAGDVVLWNAGAERLFGWTAQEMLGRPAADLVPPDRVEELNRVLRALLGAPEQAAVETYRLTRTGEVLPVSCRISPLLDGSGRPYAASAVVRDNSREMHLRTQLEQARAEADARFTQSVVAQATIDPAGRVTAVNPRLCELTGYAEKQLLGRRVLEFLAPDELDSATPRLHRLLSGQVRRTQHQRRLRHADGHFLDTHVSLFSVLDADGTVLRVEAVVEDVTTAVAAQRALAASEARWQSLALHAADVAFLADAQGTIAFASGSVTAQFGYPVEQVLGADGFSYFHPEDLPAVRAHWARALAHPGASLAGEARIRHADGSWRWIENTVSNRLQVPGIEAMVVNMVDVTDRKQAESVLQELARHDVLTGLLTRAPLIAAVDAGLAQEQGAELALVVFDLDRFRVVNATHGHQVGDDVLTSVAARLRRCTDGVRVAARLSDDRFAVLLEGVGGIEQATRRAENLLAVVTEPTRLVDLELDLSATAGVAYGPAADSGSLLTTAEAALAQAKSEHRGSVVVRPAQSSASLLERAMLVEDLRRGLAADELVVHFQPVMCLTDGRMASVEALVRWQHPQRGLLPPGAFIDAAEDSGLIVEVGEVVLRHACAAAARWARLGRTQAPFQVAVNLSARQLTAPGVVELVQECLRSAGADPRNVMLEVTESAVMADVEATGRTLQRLRELGLSIAVDDFGTGYSSLTYLKRFPVTCVKIDRSFVSGLGEDAQDSAIVSSVLNLARAIGLDCIAEGIETTGHLEVLQELGCQLGQGFLWSPAVSAEELERWLARVSPQATSAVPPAQLGATDEVLELIRHLHESGASLHSVAAALNADRRRTAEGKRWSASAVAQVIAISG
jgi:diguanylate cyclase (GGDEF)-like protein/PAS domain S-box-containing protein